MTKFSIQKSTLDSLYKFNSSEPESCDFKEVFFSDFRRYLNPFVTEAVII